METELLASLTDVADLLEMASTDPPAAADLLEAWAEELLAVAARLRESVGDDGTRDPGGLGDKVFARVIGPDGNTRRGGT